MSQHCHLKVAGTLHSSTPKGRSMLEILSPPPVNIVSVISQGIARENEVSSIARYDFAIVERDGEAFVGGITASISFAVLFINNIWVDGHARGRGVGRSLIAAAEAEGLRLGAETSCVDTLTTQAPAFYLRLGYLEFGRLEGWVEAKAVDRIWFKRQL
ncbi:GNAT family N-acetyltransferase [Devosia sp. LC5]|uniref:GNAT family N-acetyltransferase n=1 Tax=Devosia sp. LC5 TaxID=1502724 RepID=UPI001FCB2838|nr:GNAT family N-acetyltransferase [Devosia sp. LC5]